MAGLAGDARLALSTDTNAARVVVEDDHSYLMLMARDFFQSQSDRPIGDPATTVTSATLIFLDSREAVDAALAAGLAAGGAEARPAADYGFLYQRQLTDPDGHVLEFGHMDPVPTSRAPGPYRWPRLDELFQGPALNGARAPGNATKRAP